jgi:RNA polymerase sigma-70 factor (ECF subfamily)
VFPSLHNEKLILQSLARGEESAFRQVYDHYAEHVYSVALLHLKQVELAEDVVQSVFLKLWESRGQLDRVAAFAGWLYVLTRNTIISILRRQGTQAAYLDFLKRRTDLFKTSFEQEISRKEQVMLVRKGIEQLSFQQRTALRLQQDEGLTYQGIAERMGISPNTVRVHLFKAMESLRHFVQMHSRDVMIVILLLFHEFT